MKENVKLIVPKQTSEHSYLNNPDVNYSKALMLHPEQQHLKFNSFLCLHTYITHPCPCHFTSQSLQRSSLWCGHTGFVTPLPHTPADVCLTPCTGPILPSAGLCWFLLPLLTPIFKGLPSSSPDLLL